MIRAFVAIPVGEEAGEALVAQQAGLTVGRAVPAENLHLTLAFLGERPMPVVEDVHYALDAIRAPGFEIRFAGLGLLGERARVVHAVVQPDPRLKHLRNRVLEAVRGAGIAVARERFVPHVTLVRLGPGVLPEDMERLRGQVAARAGFAAGPFEINSFALFRSHLGRSGAVYEEMASYPLVGTGTGGFGA
jgi:2'-5' RNA ligase